MSDIELIPLEAIADPTVRETMKAADVIFGVDVSRGTENIFWGRTALRKIVNSGKSKPLKVMRFAYDQRTDSLEYLCAAVEVVKGAHSYLPKQ